MNAISYPRDVEINLLAKGETAVVKFETYNPRGEDIMEDEFGDDGLYLYR